MSIKPITFSAPMVRALLAGRKTQTRRLLNLPKKSHSGGPIYEHPKLGGWEATTVGGDGCFAIDKASGQRVCVPERAAIWHQTTGTTMAAPIAPGHRLYVREHWKTTPAYDDLSPSDMGGDEPLRYLADDATFNWAEADGEWCGRHRQAMHMPRWASRIWLAVTDVRVQRLQECSEPDAEAEGCVWDSADGHDVWYVPGSAMPRNGATALECYSLLWDTLHTEPGTRWGDNPWIMAVTFDRRHGNIDAEAPHG